MNKFKCEMCGNCCQDYGRDPKIYPFLSDSGVLFLNRPKVVLYDWEKKVFPDGSLVPCELLIDLKKKICIVMSYTFKDGCPNLSSDKKCKVYNNRPIACRGFPCPYSDVEFIKDLQQIVDNSRICKAEMNREELYDYLSVKKGEEIIVENKDLIKKLYMRYGDCYVYCFMKSINDRLVGEVLIQLQLSNTFKFLKGNEELKTVLKKLKKCEMIRFSDVFKRVTGKELKDNFSAESFKTIEKIIKEQING